MKKLLACALVATMSGCPDVKVDPGEGAGGPTVEFDPARSQLTKARFIPFPNDLVRDPATGKINLPEQACESMTSKVTREQILNQLDGFGTFETAMQVTFTEPVDEASLADHIVMYQLTDAGMPVSATGATPVPVKVVKVGATPRLLDGKCDAPEMVNSITFVPAVPLKQKSTYFVALLKGIKDTSGQEFAPAYTWGLVSSATPPVVLDDSGIIVSDLTPLDPADPEQRAQLIALAGVWQLHAPGLKFLDEATMRPRTDYLVGFQFTTQTVTDPLDPKVAGSPAAKLGTVGLLQTGSVIGRFGQVGAQVCADAGETNPTQCFLKLALGGCSPLTTGCTSDNYNAGNAACQLVNGELYKCASVGDVVGGGVLNADYQQELPNTQLPGGAKLHGAWTDPVKPEQQATVTLETIVVMPTGNSPQNNGWPTIVFAHGLGSSKESVLAIAGRLAAAGFATVAIDNAGHGSRAVRISNDINLGCSGMCFSGTTPTGTHCDTIMQCGSGETCGSLAATPQLLPPSPTTAPQCYAPFLSPDLATTRDGMRQTVLDHQRVVQALKTCGKDGCAGISINPNKIYFLGMSLGGIIGSVSAGLSPDIKTAVINVGGVGWVDILENTETLAIRCSLVNGLIDAGILTGEKWTGGTTGLCTTDAWKEQPGYGQFATIGRWVLDSVDGANFASRLAAKHVSVQEAVGDTVVPNIATDNLGALLGLTSAKADGFNPASPAPSAALTTMPTANKFLKYESDANNVFVHSSLLRPAPTTPPTAGVFGTMRMQIDAATYFSLNNQ